MWLPENILKTLDGDDWYDTGNFVKFISDLKRIDADMIITPFTFVNEVTGEKEVLKSDKQFVGKLRSLKHFLLSCIRT